MEVKDAIMIDLKERNPDLRDIVDGWTRVLKKDLTFRCKRCPDEMVAECGGTKEVESRLEG